MRHHQERPEPDHGVGGELRRDRYVGGVDLTHWYTPLGRGLERLVRAVAKWVGPNAALVLSLVMGIITVIALTTLAAEVYDAVTEADGVAGLDHPLLAYALTLRSPTLDAAVTAYTDIAGVIGMPVLAIVAMLVLAFRRRSLTPVILILAAGTGSLLMTIAGKELIGRNRPELADAVPPYEYSPSFPSGHSLNAIVIAGIIAYLLILRQRSTRARVLTGTIALLFALTIGLSRVYLGHHWFTDVLAAWALGAAWLALVITAHRLYLSIRRRGAASLEATRPARTAEDPEGH